MTMQTKRKFTARKWLAAMLCLTIALVALNITTWAVDLKILNDLTVTTEEKIDEGTEIMVDIYQLAVANPVPGVDTYGYLFNPDFAGLKIQIGEKETDVSVLENGTVSLSQEQWEQMAQDASSLVKEGKVKQDPVQISFGATTSLSAGLYLLIARGTELNNYWDTSENDKKIITTAESEYNKYSFSPALISLPTKKTEKGVIPTTDVGDWAYTDIIVNMKASIKPRLGSIKITKNIDRFEGSEEKTFVFLVTGRGDFDNVEGYEYKYSNVTSVYFTASTGLSSYAILGNIPVGTEIVSVEEIYPESDNPNSRYILTGFSGPEKTPWIVSDKEEEVLEFTFTNVLNDIPSGGHGIMNQFINDGSIWEPKQIDSKHR